MIFGCKKEEMNRGGTHKQQTAKAKETEMGNDMGLL